MYFLTAALLLAPAQVQQDTAHKKPVEMPEVVVTATRSPLDPLESPFPASLLKATSLDRNLRPSLAAVTADQPGVRALSTGAIIAKPVIRGLAGARVLTLDNGFRLEDYSWSDEDGPSADPHLAERVEIVRGPASLLYGSDAIGGVVNTLAEPIPVAATGQRVSHASAELFGASNNPGVGAGVDGDLAGERWGGRVHLIGRFAGNTITPECELENTGFTQLNGEAAVGVHGGAGSATLRVARFGGEFKLLEAGGLGASIPAGCPGGPPKPANETATGPERKVDDNRVQLSGDTHWHGLGLEARAQYQGHSTIELSDDLTPGTESETIHLDLRTVTLELLAHHQIGRANGTFGVSGLTQTNATSGLAPLVPDGDNTGAAVFDVERIPFGAVSILAGLRGDTRHLSADSNAALALSAQTRDATAWSGDLGLVVDLGRGFAIAGNVGRAFRAPSLFELFSNGPRLGEDRYEVGDPTLVPETSLNLDASLRWQSASVRGEVAGFRNRIANFVYITPTAQFRQVGTVAQPDSLRVYQYTQAQATLYGAELSFSADLTSRVSGYTRAEYVHGQNDQEDQPLPLMPPARAVAGAEWHTAAIAAHPWYAGLEVEAVAEQRRLAAYNVPGQGFQTYDIPTAGYVLLGVTGGVRSTVFGRAWQLDARVRNATNAKYRDYLNRYKEFALDAGRALEVRVATEF